MAFERQDNVREYYRRITEVDIGMVARELLGAHVLHESDRLLQCDCPNHSSQWKWYRVVWSRLPPRVLFDQLGPQCTQVDLPKTSIAYPINSPTVSNSP